jgi:hypothetical protein
MDKTLCTPRRSGIPALLVTVAAALLAPADVAAQSPADRDLYLGGSVGAFAGFPEDFHDRYCTQDTWGAVGEVGVGVTSFMALEASATAANGLGGALCVMPGVPAPLPGSRFPRDRFGDGVGSNDFFATALSSVFHASQGRHGLAGRIGVGRLWDKHVNALRLGVEYRLRLGGQETIVGLDHWRMAVPFEREQILVGPAGELLVQSSESLERQDSALLIRVGYRVTVR